MDHIIIRHGPGRLPLESRPAECLFRVRRTRSFIEQRNTKTSSYGDAELSEEPDAHMETLSAHRFERRDEKSARASRRVKLRIVG